MREIVYGRQPVMELLRAGRRRTHFVLARRGDQRQHDLGELLALAAASGVEVRPVSPEALDARAQGGNHQGVAAEADPYPCVPFADVRADVEARGPSALLLALDHVQDPQNLGALLRTAVAAGVHGVIIPNARAAGVTPAAVRASAGAAEHARVCIVANLPTALRSLKDAGVWFACLEATPEARLYTEADLTGSLGLVLGGEGRGAGRLVRETCDYLIRVPMAGGVSSLNVSVAAGIALYEVIRQRAAAGPRRGEKQP